MKLSVAIIALYTCIVGVFLGYAWRMIQPLHCPPCMSMICDEGVTRSKYHGIQNDYYWRCDQYLVRDGETINLSEWREKQ